MTSFGGYNVGRTLVGGAQRSEVGAERRNGAHQASPPVLQTAVVLEVYCDLGLVTGDLRERLIRTANNGDLVDVMPANSVLAQVVSNQEGLSATSSTILFPLYSSHFQMPVKVGEQVQVIYQDIAGKGVKVGYWVTRIHGQRAVEDVNYAHQDRQFDALNNLQNWSSTNISQIDDCPPPGFPNGAGTIDTYTLRPIDNQEDPYLDALNRSSVARYQIYEPVPRFIKRPGDLVLQGSNNTLIRFGDDRVGPAVPETTPEGEVEGFSGTIDMVVGRGRWLPDDPDTDPELTAPRIVENSRGNLETDKAPWRAKNPQGGRVGDNPTEGDPDYINDAARLLLTMQAPLDDRLGLTEIEFPSGALPITQPTGENATPTTANRSYVGGIADHVRLVSRQDQDHGIDGTVAIVRNGTPDSDTDGLYYVYLTSHGGALFGKRWFFGSAAHDDPRETDINYNDNDGPYEPWILWSKYRDTVNSLQKQINDLEAEHKKSIQAMRDNMKSILTGIENAFSANSCPPYGQNPGLVAAKVAISSLKSTLDTPVDTPLSSASEKVSNEQNNNNNNNVSKSNHSQGLYGS